MQADTLVEAAESRTLGRLTNPVRGALQASAAVGAAVPASSLLSRTPAEPGTRWTLVFYGAAMMVVGLLYGVGVVVLATKRPRLWPRAFSYHELFHVLVMAAAYAHYLVIVSVTVA